MTRTRTQSLAASLLTLLALVAVLFTATPAPSLPACEYEDGSTQYVCVFHGSDGRDYVNINYGQTYYTR